MATVHTRYDKDGNVSSYQVKWRLGGKAGAPWQTERFTDEPSAGVFRDAVNAAGQQWPLGWVKGKGYITAEALTGDEEQFRFRNYATEILNQRANAGKRYRDGSLGELERYVFPTFGNCDVRSTTHFSRTTIAEWLLLMQQTMVWKGSKHRPMSPKTIKNIHGLLSGVLRMATREEPPLRQRNPCELSSLPKARLPVKGVEDEDEYDGPEDIEFLEPDEVAGIVDCLERPEDKRLVRVAFATGLRWGELTALAGKHIAVSSRGKRSLTVSRAWKWDSEQSYYLGPPKTERSNRTIRLSSATWVDLVDQGVGSSPRGRLVFHNGQGKRLPYSTFYDRWCDAVRRAHDEGTLPDYKAPTIHDLRHSHAAVLLSDGRGLAYVQRRLGHESIQTTVDRYGHLTSEADDDAMDAIDASLGHKPGGEAEAEAQADDRAAVYVAQLGNGEPHLEGFWKRADAELVAEQWGQDRRQPARVETWAQDWWVRQHGNGLKDVRSDVPERAQIWFMGPAVYGPDGVLVDPHGPQHEPEARAVWEWEQAYTEEPEVSRVEWREGGRETEAEVWGVSRQEVTAAYGRACITALQVCGLNPALAGGVGEEGQDDAGVSAVHTEP